MADIVGQLAELPAQDVNCADPAEAKQVASPQAVQKQPSSKAGALAAAASTSRISSSKGAGLTMHPDARTSSAQPSAAVCKSIAATAASSGQISSKSHEASSASASGSGPLDKIRAARANAAAAAASSSSKDNVASTISRAKMALAKARAAAAGGLTSSHSSLTTEEGVGVISDKPFTLYGRTEPPKPKLLPQIKPSDKEEEARRKAWHTEKQAMRERRLAQEAARKEREEAAKATAAAARAEAHHKLVEERKAKYDAYKAREAEMVKKSEEAWKQFQESRGRPPLFKIMEDEFKAKRDAEEEAKRAAYEADVASAKLATVSQLVKGEVVIRPPAGSISPGRSRSPGVPLHSPLGSGELSRSQIMGRTSPHSTSSGRHGLNGSWGGAKAGTSKFPGSSAAAAAAKQLVDRACSPLTPGQIPLGAKIVPTRLARKPDLGGQPPVTGAAASKQPSKPNTRNSSMRKPAADAAAQDAAEPYTQPTQQLKHQPSHNQEHVQVMKQQDLDEPQQAMVEAADLQQDEEVTEEEQQHHDEVQPEADWVEEEGQTQEDIQPQQVEDQQDDQQDDAAAQEVLAEDDQQQPEYESDAVPQAQGSVGQEAEQLEETEAAEGEEPQQEEQLEVEEGEEVGDEYAGGEEQQAQGEEVAEEATLERVEEPAAHA